ncbi:glycoside hydrolase family 95 protein [Pseudochryseolinea flava]|uniref:Glycoside hydrolase family 95 protein n=1 Tax=Pseudochryseolinea flava TaxID=2059302 RepID=A0A364XVK9_9BACT|nr:glycoside hydrolase family 95 protein [Pseudochryseolinea flava]RAV98209.1 glycoside hydrolase family 95 protein [Pseudochryseolinea flava]
MLKCIAITIFFASLVTEIQAQQHQLWYDKPAANWNEALPIGNGRIAAMIFGGPGQERLQLNEETVWAGEPGNNIPSTAFYESLRTIQKSIFDGDYQSAHDRAMTVVPRHAPSDNNYGMPYQPVCDVLITFPGHDNFKQYKRTLDIGQAVSTTTYEVNDVMFTREIFSSFTDQVFIVRMSASEKNKITCKISLTSPHEKYSIRSSVDNIILTGTSGSHANKKGSVLFTTIAKAINVDGQISTIDNSIVIEGASTVTLFISIGTNFKSYNNVSGDQLKKATDYISSATQKKYSDLKYSHIKYYKKFYDRVSLSLGSSEPARKPTNIQLEEFKDTEDPTLVALYYQFGRYLLICSSQPGTQPANLQGKWNNSLSPPWDSKYTININTEMNYWPAEVTNLSELHQPLFMMLKDLEQTGKVAAEKLYRARGWVVHHNTDLWRIAGPVDGSYYGLWPMGSAWLSQHIWQHYLFTGDKNHLQKYYTTLKGAALFYHDILVEEPKNKWLVVSPSMSPENEHRRGISIAAGTTMDNQLVFDVFSNFIDASTILTQDEALRDSIIQKRNRLAPMQVGQFGQLQEWLEDWDRADDKHRHVSHLYGLYPSNQISVFRHPSLFQAARTSLIHRGDHSTGWSMGWKVNLWARLLDGERAYQLIKAQLTPVHEGESHGGTYLNLLDAHPPFQIDGNFGCTSGITEMLVQSHDGAIHLLPALPARWSSGSVSGIRTRGGFEIDLSWNHGRTRELKVTSTIGGICRIRSTIPLHDDRLKKVDLKNTNELLRVNEIKQPVILKLTTEQSFVAPVVYEYDFTTERGKVYAFVVAE